MRSGLAIASLFYDYTRLNVGALSAEASSEVDDFGIAISQPQRLSLCRSVSLCFPGDSTKIESQ